MKGLASYALFNLTYNGFRGIYNLYYKFYAGNKNLLQRYGHKSWAVVTGGAEGIGRGFARELAKWGFNLVLMDNQADLLEKTSIELAQSYPNIEIRKIVTDFRKSAEDGYFEELQTHFEDLDVSILVNNVGICVIEPFNEHDFKSMKEMMLVNMFPLAFMTRIFLPKMILRAKKSAVITIASEESKITLPKFTLYGGTKAFAEHFTQGLIEEYGDRVDFLTVHPGLVSTRLTKFVDVGFSTITPEECARDSVKKLGAVSFTYGGWRHEILNGLANNFKIFKGIYAMDLEKRFQQAQQRNKELGIKA